ncbi:MAG: hypothetical protein JO214_10610 [Frankiaceae bacterium]|nr:hypothetical protein [Frankiaceae bacterium]
MTDSWTPPTSDPSGFFAATPTAPIAPTAAPSTPVAAPQVNQFGTPVAPPQVNQFGTPVAASPTTWSPYPVAATPPKQSRNMWVVGVAILVGLISIGAAVQVFLRNHHSLSTPQTINGTTLMTDPRLDQIKSMMLNGLDSNGIHGGIAGFYGNNGLPTAMVLAAHGRGSADSKMSEVESGLRSDTELTTPLSSAPAGKLGGRMECGAMSTSGLNIPICLWADGDTVGMIGLFGASPADAPATALTYREAVEH